MKRIKADFNQKDRVVCVTIPGSHKFYYQPVGSKERILLFITDDFYGSVFAYFRDKGKNMSDRGFSLTIKELYEFKRFRNVKLTNVINQIPMEIDYVLREQRKYREAVNNGLTTREERINSSCEDREHVA